MRVLSTPRLSLRPLAPSGADALHALWTQPDVRRYLWDDAVLPPEHTTAILEENERRFATEGLGLWGCYGPASEALIGFAGYWYFFEPPEHHLLYGLAPERWGQGLATEAARAVLHYGFTEGDLTAILAATDPPNLASQRVLDRLGMTYTGEKQRGEQVTRYYHLTRRAFLEQC